MGTVYAYVWSLLYCWHVEYTTCLLLVHLLPLSLPPLFLSPSHTNTFVVDSFAHSSWICECDLFFEKSHEIGSVALLFFIFLQYAICESLSWNVIEAFSRPIVAPRVCRFLKVYCLLSSTKELAYQKIGTSGDLFSVFKKTIYCTKKRFCANKSPWIFFYLSEV